MTSPVDVNQAFTAERAAQLDSARARQDDINARIADGRLRRLGNDRYQVVDPGSFDNGEIWTLRNGQVLPQHGLDTSLGQAALYTTTPAWHGLGTVIPGGVTDIDTVLKLGGIDFEVAKRPVLYQVELDGAPRVFADQFVTVRTDTDAPLGVVGSKYQVMQNRDDFVLLQELVDQFDVTWESAGALRGGRRVFVSMRLPNTVTIDAGGINDQIIPFIAAINSHDGSSLFQMVVTPWRIACGNTERFAVRDAITRWGIRHTANAPNRIIEARRHLKLSVNYFDAFAAEEEALARTDLAIDEFRKVIDEVWPLPDEPSQRTRNNHAARYAHLVELFDNNAAQLGRTAYAGERAVTGYLDHFKTVRPSGVLKGRPSEARATAIMEGADDDRKSKTHRRLMLRVR